MPCCAQRKRPAGGCAGAGTHLYRAAGRERASIGLAPSPCPAPLAGAAPRVPWPRFGFTLRPSGLIDVFFATSKTRQKNARTWPTHTPFGSAPREESIAGVFAVLQGKRFFGPPAGALCLDYVSLKSLLRRHWAISNLYPTPYPILNPRTSRIPPQSSTLALATDDGGQWCLVPFSQLQRQDNYMLSIMRFATLDLAVVTPFCACFSSESS